MIKKLVKYGKIAMALFLITGLTLPSYATVGAADGSAFVTKAEFDSALSDFNARLTTFEAGINSKIDSQVSSYLDRNGIWNGKEFDCYFKNGWVFSNDYYSELASWTTNSNWEANIWSKTGRWGNKYVNFPNVYQVINYTTSVRSSSATTANTFKCKIFGSAYGGSDFYWASGRHLYDASSYSDTDNGIMLYPLGKINKSGMFDLTYEINMNGTDGTACTGWASDWSAGVNIAFVSLPPGATPLTSAHKFLVQGDGSSTYPYVAGGFYNSGGSSAPYTFYDWNLGFPGTTINARFWSGYYQKIAGGNYLTHPSGGATFFVQNNDVLWLVALGRGFSIFTLGTLMSGTGYNDGRNGIFELPIRFMSMKIY